MAQKNASGTKVENTMIPKFDAGLFYEASIAPEFYLRPELNFAAKGAKMKGTSESKIQVNYLEVPVMFLYKGALSGGNVMLGFGPYLGLGVGGKTSLNGT
ncbi:MAG TPA: outer membrane beta-barrel protein, partial [Prolixibacteraceae bacterium]|nr:outer membrane beta-barrel protein [Prolixibacteraceae bacterium]